MKRLLCVFGAGILALAVLIVPGSSDQPKPLAQTVPQYNKQGELIRPTDFRTWVFVGANIGLAYGPKAAANTPRAKDQHPPAAIGNFHNVYINPEAYAHYARTGKFPDPTILVLDVYQAKTREPQGIVTQGFYPAAPLAVEVAVKNSKRPDGQSTDWAYYDFSTPTGHLRATAKARPNRACYDCHKKHASDDNVWVQFYPTLRELTKPGG